MINRMEFTYLSSDKKTIIHAAQWMPDKVPVAVLQIAHGITEHIMRYDKFAKYMATQGFLVVGNDHIGHGHSVVEGAQPLYFGPEGSWELVVQDVYQLFELTSKKFPDLPYCFLGHSLGSFLVRHCLIKYPDMMDAAVLMGTGQLPQWAILLGKIGAGIQARKSGEDVPNKMVKEMLFGSYNKKFKPNRTTADWLCFSEKGVDQFLQDPLCRQDVTPGIFRELMNGMAFTCKWKNLRQTDSKVPVLFVSGKSDPVGDNGRGIRLAYERFRKAGVRDTDMRLYPDLRHNLLDEECWENVSQDICQWLVSHFAR